MKKIVVEKCIDCPSSRVYRSNVILGCERCGKIIVDFKKDRIRLSEIGIPDWCPLPNDEMKVTKVTQIVSEPAISRSQLQDKVASLVSEWRALNRRSDRFVSLHPTKPAIECISRMEKIELILDTLGIEYKPRRRKINGQPLQEDVAKTQELLRRQEATLPNIR